MDFTYSFQNLKRDISKEFAVIMQLLPFLIGLLKISSQAAVNPKHEWIEDVMTAEGDSLAAEAAAGAGTITVADGTAFSNEMILVFEGYDEQARVDSIAGNVLTVTRQYGSTPSETIASGTNIKIVSRPRPEGTDPGDDPGQKPVTQWNQTEIFDFTAKASKTAQYSDDYTIDDALQRSVKVGMDIIGRRMNNALIYGRRVARDASNNGSAGGLLYFLSQTGANLVDAASSAITATLLNDTFEEIVKRGGQPNTILCNTNQARKITAFHADNLEIERHDQNTGSAVYRFVNDLPMGIITQIAVDMNFPRTKLSIIDTTKIDIVPFKGRALSDEDATPNGADYLARRMLGEYTFRVGNHKEAHALIEGLTE